MIRARLPSALLPLAACCACAADDVARDAAAPVEPAPPSFVELPFRSNKEQVLVDVVLGDEGPLTFLVDTGVTGVVVDLGAARRAGVELDESTAQELRFGSDDGGKLYPTTIPRLRVGALELSDVPAAALSLEPFARGLGEPLHGVLGDGVLGERVTRYDFAARRLAFADDLAAFEADVDAADWVTPMRVGARSGMPLVDVRVAGGTFVASIDTGSSLGLEIFLPHVEELGLGHALEEWPTSPITGGSIGRALAYEGALPAVDVGPLTFADVPTSLTPDRGDAERQGNVGNALWRGCVVIFDYPGERLVVRGPR